MLKKLITKIKIKCSSNNTILHASNIEMKNIIVSPGLIGFKGAKRSTTYASQQVAEYLGEKLNENNVKDVILIFKGFGKGKKSIIKGLTKKKIKIFTIVDKILTAHNGCRLPKQRRL
jgi:small subunit ribosomal protein S11